uniref:Putative ovule protein n=1 Tax=Solanum chacoense TaxID=4108 RepID=A0A0V0H2Y4_SOLCH
MTIVSVVAYKQPFHSNFYSSICEQVRKSQINITHGLTNLLPPTRANKEISPNRMHALHSRYVFTSNNQ